MTANRSILAALDIGNGYVKGRTRDLVDGTLASIDIPSCSAYVTGTHDLKADVAAIPGIIADIFNNMDVSFDSPLVKDQNRRFLGKRGLQSGMPLEEFDVFSHVSKAKQDLSGILILSCLAGTALQQHYNKTGSLPADMLRCDARVALALPIREYKKYRVEYADSLKSASHIVTFHNFEQRVRVQVDFRDVQVLAEGASAQYAIMSKGPEFVEAALADCRRLVPLAGITAHDVMSAMTTVGVDIGEGTVNFPVFQNGKFNADASVTLDKGYGSILTRALDRLQDAGFAFDSRKELADYVQTKPSAIKKAAYNKVTAVIQEETVAFVNDIKMQIVKVMSRVGAFVEVAYVYGGGASPVQSLLHKELVAVSQDFSNEFPILYLDSTYSRFLNREGLLWIADQVAKADAEATANANQDQ